MIKQPLFLIFVNTKLSSKLIEQIKKGVLHAYIYTSPSFGLQLKKIFSTNMNPKSKIKIIITGLPFNYEYFNIFFTSNSLWDNIPNNYSRVFALYNPRAVGLNINLGKIIENKLPFGLISLTPNINFHIIIRDNPAIVDEQLSRGFLFYITSKYARKSLSKFKKSHILSIRKRLNMKNNEHIERLPITPFYLYFYHFMQSLDYSEPNQFIISNPKSWFPK